MIKVKKGKDESSQKIVATFLKRVKKSNLIARARKTQFQTKALSTLKKRRKKARQMKYAEESSHNRAGKL